MSSRPAPPPGFERLPVDGATLLVAREHVAAVRAAGLGRERSWRALLASGGAGGRGSTARLELADGTALRLKQMRRGGLPGRILRERFVGTRRLTENLRIPLEAARRGVATAAPVALLLVPGRVGLYRAWLALTEIADAPDLERWLGSEDPPRQSELQAVVDLLRAMHDAGLDHRDLHLGNLLLRRGSGRPPAAFVVDLDRARLLPGPLGFRRRQRSLRRLERSAVKRFGGGSVGGIDLRSFWYVAYAAGDPILARRLQRARRRNRLAIALHRLSWRR